MRQGCYKYGGPLDLGYEGIPDGQNQGKRRVRNSDILESMISPITQSMFIPEPPIKRTLAKEAQPDPGKWVLIRTPAYQRIARFENGVWKSVDGKAEKNPVIDWKEL
jgi:hypothetical protein